MDVINNKGIEVVLFYVFEQFLFGMFMFIIVICLIVIFFIILVDLVIFVLGMQIINGDLNFLGFIKFMWGLI